MPKQKPTTVVTKTVTLRLPERLIEEVDEFINKKNADNDHALTLTRSMAYQLLIAKGLGLTVGL